MILTVNLTGSTTLDVPYLLLLGYTAYNVLESPIYKAGYLMRALYNMRIYLSKMVRNLPKTSVTRALSTKGRKNCRSGHKVVHATLCMGNPNANAAPTLNISTPIIQPIYHNNNMPDSYALKDKV